MRRFPFASANGMNAAHMAAVADAFGVYNIQESYGAENNLGKDSTDAIGEALSDAQAKGGGLILVPNGTFLFTTVTIDTAANIVVAGVGRRSRLICTSPTGGFIVNVANTGGDRVVLRDLVLELGAALTVPLLDVRSADGFELENITVHRGLGAAFALAATGVRLGECNNGVMKAVSVLGAAGNEFAVGLDLFNANTGNRGNVDVRGGLINRANVAVDIANGSTNVVNNIKLDSLKMVHTSSAAGTIGVRGATRLTGIVMVNAHVEGFETCVDMTGVDNASIINNTFSAFGDSASGVAVKIKQQCTRFDILQNRFTNPASSGVAVDTDASQHLEINFPLRSNLFSNVATLVNNLSTPSGGVVFGNSGKAGYPVVQTDQANIVTNCNLGRVFQVTLAGNRNMSAPLNPNVNDVIWHRVIQDGTGARTLTWDAVFKNTWSNTGNTANKETWIAHRYNGASWIQCEAQSPYNG